MWAFFKTSQIEPFEMETLYLTKSQPKLTGEAVNIQLRQKMYIVDIERLSQILNIWLKNTDKVVLVWFF